MLEESASEFINNPEKLQHFLINENVSNIVKLLERFGKLNDEIDYASLLVAIEHPNKKVRSLVIKNIAKTKDLAYLNLFTEILSKDQSMDVRREAASAIGRMRNRETFPTLFKLTQDKDPEVVLQAIRGLLVFKEDELVAKKLLSLKNHQNEIIRKIIDIEFSPFKKDKKSHINSPEYMHNVCVKGDVMKILEKVEDESVHLTFTSPPYYNARDYSIYSSYDEYIKFLSNLFKEIHRVTKEGRFFVLNSSPIIIPRVGRKYSSTRYPIPYDLHKEIVDNGWEFVDDILWSKNEASVMNRNGGFFQHRKPLTYKPNARTECIMVYRKKTNKLLDWNIDQYPEKIINESRVIGKYESSNVWEINPVSDKKHSAVFPEELCNRIVSFYSFVGDLVFDPFAGRGTLGRSAIKLKRKYFMTEIDEKYFETMKDYLLLSESDLKNFNVDNQQFVDIKKFKNIKK